MKKTAVLFISLLLFVFLSNFNTVFANEATDLKYQAQDEYYAKRYGYSVYFHETTEFYRPPLGQRLRDYPERYKQVRIYKHQSPSGVPTIGDWQVSQITPWVDFVPGASISSGSAVSSTFTSGWTYTAGIELTILEDILKASGSVSYSETYSSSFHQEYGIVANYEYARSILGDNSGYTDYAIVMKQGMGKYKTFNYQGKSVVWHFTIYHGAKDAISEWNYLGVGYFTAPLEGITYTKYSVIGTTFN